MDDPHLLAEDGVGREEDGVEAEERGAEEDEEPVGARALVLGVEHGADDEEVEDEHHACGGDQGASMSCGLELGLRCEFGLGRGDVDAQARMRGWEVAVRTVEDSSERVPDVIRVLEHCH